MRIAINTRFLLPNKLEGIGWYTYEVTRRMVLNHPNDEFFFFFDRAFDQRFIFAKNVTPIILFPPARHPFLFVAWYEAALTNALRRYNCDVFWSPDNFLSLQTLTPTVLTVHDLAYKAYPEQVSFFVRQYYQYFTPRYLRKAKNILTVSQFVKEDIIRHFQTDTEKITVAHNGSRTTFAPIDAKAQQTIRQQFTQGDAYFLYVGAIQPRKNVLRLIQAFELFKQQTQSAVKLVLVGRMAWGTLEVSQAIEQSVFCKDIIHLGYVEQLEQLVASALAVVYVSLFEGFGLPILEAMCCDVPVITSNTTSMPEVAGDAALLVNPHDVNALADALKRIATNPELRQELIAKGRVQRQRFDWDTTAEIVYAVITQTAKSAEHIY